MLETDHDDSGAFTVNKNGKMSIANRSFWFLKTEPISTTQSSEAFWLETTEPQYSRVNSMY